MTQYRNVGDETYQDFITGKSAEPDAVIDVPDDFAEFYKDHSIWREVGAPAPPPPTNENPQPVLVPDPAQSLVTTSEVPPAEDVVASQPVDANNQEQN